jgi:hypothetical protein
VAGRTCAHLRGGVALGGVRCRADTGGSGTTARLFPVFEEEGFLFFEGKPAGSAGPCRSAEESGLRSADLARLNARLCECHHGALAGDQADLVRVGGAASPVEQCGGRGALWLDLERHLGACPLAACLFLGVDLEQLTVMRRGWVGEPILV